MPTPHVTAVQSGPRKVSRRTVIDASAERLFAIVADPTRHGELDGSGTVKDTVSGPDRLHSGAKFSVKMKQYGVPYKITSTVTEFVDNSVVEWQHPLGHKWRWEFEPVTADQTTVTETFDYSGGGLRAKLQEVMGFPAKNSAGIENTLAQLRRRYSD